MYDFKRIDEYFLRVSNSLKHFRLYLRIIFMNYINDI